VFFWKKNFPILILNVIIESKLLKLIKPVAQYNSKGEFIRIFESCADAARAYGSYVSNISGACEMDIKHRGFYWRFIKGKPDKEIPIRQYQRGGKPVIVRKEYGGHLTLVAITSCIIEARALTGCSTTTIRNYARSKDLAKTTPKGYNFRFVDDDDKVSRIHYLDIFKKRYPGTRQVWKKPVIITYQDGTEVEFESVGAAAKVLKVNRAGVIHALRGRQARVKGCKARYKNPEHF